MAHYTSVIQFYLGDIEQDIVCLTQAYELACEKYKEESNRCIHAAIIILNREVMQLSRDLPIKSETTGIEKTEYQSIANLIEAYKVQINALQSELKREGLDRSGFAVGMKRTWQ